MCHFALDKDIILIPLQLDTSDCKLLVLGSLTINYIDEKLYVSHTIRHELTNERCSS